MYQSKCAIIKETELLLIKHDIFKMITELTDYRSYNRKIHDQNLLVIHGAKNSEI